MFLKLKSLFNRAKYNIKVAKYDKVYYYLGNKGLAPVKKDGKWGYVDKTGKEVIECKYDDAGFFSEGLAPVKKNGKWGFIDKTEKEVIECKYDGAWSFDKGLAKVNKDGKWGFIDKTEKEVVECNYNYVCSFSGGLSEVTKDGKYGYVDKNGKEVVECKYDYLVVNHKCNSDNFKQYYAFRKDLAKAGTTISVSEAKSQEEIDEIVQDYQAAIEKLIAEEDKYLQAEAKENQAKEALEKAKQDALGKIAEISNANEREAGDDYE